MRVVVAVAFLLVPALAGCGAPGTTPLVPEFDPSVPHCVGECGRVVDDSPATSWEPFVAVNPKNPDHIVIAHADQPSSFEEYYATASRMRVSVSEDGGATWETRVVPSGLDDSPFHPLARYKAIGYDPVIVFLPDGTLVMSAIATLHVLAPDVPVIAYAGYTLYTTRSVDGGRTWGDVRIVDTGDGLVALEEVGAMFKANDKEWLTVGPDGTLLLVWTQITQGQPDNDFSQEEGRRLVFSASEDGGLTWSPAGVVDDEGNPHGASPVIGRDGAWRVAYLERASYELRFAESRDRGETWEARTIGQTSWLPAMRAQTLASGVERLLLAYATGGSFLEGQHQTEFTWSDDGGASWAPPLIIDVPEGEGPSLPDVAPAAGDGAWITYFDVEGPSSEQRSRYLAVKVVDGVAGAPLVLDEMEGTTLNLGHYMGLAVTPDGDALVAWVTYNEGEYDLVWARITGGDSPVARPIVHPTVPAGLDEPVEYEFTGHVDLAYHCLPAGHGDVEDATVDLHSAVFEFEVPPATRFVNGTLEWATHGPSTPVVDFDDLDVTLYDAQGDRFRGPDVVPEVFSFELRDGDQGPWTALVENCQNPPTDFTLSVELS